MVSDRPFGQPSSFLRSAFLMGFIAAPAFAHEGEVHAPTDGLASRWTPDVFVISLLALTALVYLRGILVLRRGGRFPLRRWQIGSFAAGWLFIVIALLSPIDFLSEALFSAHMTQHEILMLVSAPLMVLGMPLAPMMQALPGGARGRVVGALRTAPVRAVWRTLTGAWTVWILQAVVLLAWHVPVLYDAALASEPIHFVQHVSFLGVAVLFWWALVHGRYGRLGYGLAVLYVFTTALWTSLFGALITVSERPWYRLHEERTRAWAMDPVADQQLAGLIMWIPAGAIFVIVGLALFAAWMGALNARASMLPPSDRMSS